MDPQQIFARLKALTASFTGAQLASLAGAFVLVVGIVGGSAMWMNAPSYALLFSDMDPETAGDIVTRLKNQKIPYQLDEGGRAVRVPAGRVDELRLELTSQGMPASGRVGFEIFDRTAFGATEFLEQVNYRRALEGEIARTIATLAEVSNARVHIAMGKETLFGEPRPAKASVVLKLKGQRTLPASTINGIGNLVAASIDGLRPEAVVILDSFGRPLARPSADADDPSAAAQTERQQRVEKEMATRVVALLEPVLGAERVRVNVAVKLNPRTTEETEERWDPNTVIRSRQMSADSSSSLSASGGVAGSRGNLPPPADPKAQAAATAPVAGATVAPAPAVQPQLLAAAGPGSSRNAETTNYEVSRTTRRTLQPPGEIARLSVAVIVDDNQVAKRGADGQTQVTRQPRTREELQKINGVVAAAVGLEPDRGDQLTVENVSFEEIPIDAAPAPTLLQRITPQVWESSRVAVIGVVAVAALFFFVRPLMQRAGAATGRGVAGVPATMLGPNGQPRTVADLESEIEAQLDAISAQKVEARKLPVLARRVSALSTKEPENVAKLIRSWMSEPER